MHHKTQTCLFIIILWIVCILAALFPPLGILLFIGAIIWVFQQPNPWGGKSGKIVEKYVDSTKITMGPEGIKDLIDKLGSENDEVRKEAKMDLIEIGESAVPQLIDVFKSIESFNSRTSNAEHLRFNMACYALIGIGDASVKPLIKILNDDSNKKLQRFAMLTLKDIDNQEGREAILAKGYNMRFGPLPKEDEETTYTEPEPKLESYPDSLKRIFRYLGEYTKFADQDMFIKTKRKTMEDIGRHVAIILYRYAAITAPPSYEEHPIREIIDDFTLVHIAPFLEFDMNEPLKNTIDKHWTEECDVALRNFYSRYGFFSESAFTQIKLPEILGKDRLADFQKELKANFDKLKIKCCRNSLGIFWNPYRDQFKAEDIIEYYAQHLKFKWKLTLEIKPKKCVYCNRVFLPFYSTSKLFPIGAVKKIMDFYPIEKSINEINLCPEHFPPPYHSIYSGIEPENEPMVREKMKELLKKLADTLEFPPPKEFHSSFGYLRRLPIEKFEAAIAIINEMPQFSTYDDSHFNSYKRMFDSWPQALNEAGVILEGFRKTSRGYICFAKDGHTCRSIGEKVIDDYLYAHDIPHEKEPHYPSIRHFRADWKVGKYFIEFWGLKGDEDYDMKIAEKRKIAQENNIPLIEITIEDLSMLDKKFENII